MALALSLALNISFPGSAGVCHKNPLYTEFPGLKKIYAQFIRILTAYLKGTIAFIRLRTWAESDSPSFPSKLPHFRMEAKSLTPRGGNSEMLSHLKLELNGCVLKAHAKAPEKPSSTNLKSFHFHPLDGF